MTAGLPGERLSGLPRRSNSPSPEMTRISRLWPWAVSSIGARGRRYDTVADEEWVKAHPSPGPDDRLLAGKSGKGGVVGAEVRRLLGAYSSKPARFIGPEFGIQSWPPERAIVPPRRSAASSTATCASRSAAQAANKQRHRRI